jgi:type I restriction enzyme S subunit
VATTETLVLSSEAALMPAFLKFLLLSDKAIGAIAGSTYGAKMPRANWEFIGGMAVEHLLHQVHGALKMHKP